MCFELKMLFFLKYYYKVNKIIFDFLALDLFEFYNIGWATFMNNFHFDI